jgi:hypothetical protein
LDYASSRVGLCQRDDPQLGEAAPAGRLGSSVERAAGGAVKAERDPPDLRASAFIRIG